ncbi:putative membrane protein, partial [Escherichia coli 178900]
MKGYFNLIYNDDKRIIAIQTLLGWIGYSVINI